MNQLWSPCFHDGGVVMVLVCGLTNFSDLRSLRLWNTYFKWVI